MKKTKNTKTSKVRSGPIAADIREQAAALADQYRLVFQLEPDGEYLAHPLEMPLVLGSGSTVEACYRDTLEATTLAIATLLERGESPPAPAREGKRDQQVNVRLTAEEKMKLEAAANREGQSLSDYVRTAALARSR